MRTALAVLILAACTDPTPEERREDAFDAANVPVSCRYEWSELYPAGARVAWQACATACADQVVPESSESCASPYIVEVDGVRGACVGTSRRVDGELVFEVRWYLCPP